jgi:hypothetical protein
MSPILRHRIIASGIDSVRIKKGLAGLMTSNAAIR